MHDHLGVRTGPKAVTLRLQLGDQGVEVVDLTVEGDPDRPVLVRERLLAGGEVDDREPPVAEPHVAAAAFDAGAYRHGIAGPLPAARPGAVQKISFAVVWVQAEGVCYLDEEGKMAGLRLIRQIRARTELHGRFDKSFYPEAWTERSICPLSH